MKLMPGDILIAASDVDDSNIDLRNHKGEGRILHLSHDFQLKDEVRTGVDGLLVGLGRHPSSGLIFAADPTARAVFRIEAASGTVTPLDALSGAGYGTVAFGPDDQIFLGVHSHRGHAPDAVDGPKKMVEIDTDGMVIDRFPVQSDGGHTGWHGVTSIVFAPGESIAHTLSEGGRTVFRYDIATRTQLDPLINLEKHGEDKAFGLTRLATGQFLLAIGHSVHVLSPDGNIIETWPCAGERGWTRVTPALDGKTAYVSNFLEGLLERRDAATGAILARHDIQRKCALCGLVEIG